MLELKRDTSSGAATSYPNIRLDNGNASGYTGLYFLDDSVQKAGIEVKNDVGAMQFFTGIAERARITSGGDLLVGTTSALYGGERLAVNGASGAIGQTIYANGASSIALLLYSSIATGATAGKQISFVRNDGVEVGSITSNGSATSYNTTSDQRLKENIQDAAPASALIDALQVRQYDWKADGNHQRYGFIAQELVTVAPEAVHQPADPEEMMAVDYSKLVPMLVKEIQSLRQRVAQLEGK
jgi:hypothetical protein